MPPVSRFEAAHLRRSSDSSCTQRDAEREGEASKVGLIARDHNVASSGSADDHSSINHVGSAGRRTSSSCGASPGLIERLNPATRQQPRHLRLGTTAPALRQHASRNRRRQAVFKRLPMQCPCLPVAALSSNQRARVIRDSGQF